MLSSSSVFLILLGVFVAFCMFSHVKRRYTEGFEEAEAKNDDNIELDLAASHAQTFDRPDYMEFKGQTNPRKIKPTTQPTFMRIKEKVKEAFTGSSLGDWAMSTVREGIQLNHQCVGPDGITRQSAYGCCADGTPFAYEGGGNCKQTNPCSFGLCPNSTECKTDAAGSNCGKNASLGTQNPTLAGSTPTPTTSGATPTPTSGGATPTPTSGGATPTPTSGGTMSPSPYPTNLPQSCVGSIYGCCPDNKTIKNADGSNCYANGLANDETYGLTPSYPGSMGPGLLSYNTNTVLIPPPVGYSTVDGSLDPTEQSSPTETASAEAAAAEAAAAEAAATEAPPVQNCSPMVTQGPTPMSFSCPAAPPCPACARCPEPSFECKKVTNYKAVENQRFLPQAVLTDFSSFGM